MYLRLLKSFCVLCTILMFQSNTSAQCLTPISINTSNVKATKASASWYALLPQSYEIELSQSGSTSKSMYVTSPSNVTFGFLTPNTMYTYKVRTTCLGGSVSNWSSPTTFMTTGDASCPTLTNVVSSSITATAATLTWTPSAQNYVIVLSNGAKFTTSNNTFTFSGLNASTNYSYIVYAQCTNTMGNSVAGSFTTTSISCSTPSNVTVSNVDVNRANVTWTNSAGASNYKVEYKLSTDNIYKSGGYYMPDLTPNSTYDYRVSAVCAGTQSAPSTVQSFTTNAAPTCAATPTLVTASATSAYAATASWAAVVGATSYRLELINASGISSVTSSSTPTYQYTGLLPSSNYSMKVSAVCSGSQGLQSAAANFTTMAVPATCPTPTNVTVSNIELQKAKINWTMPQGAGFCKIQISEMGSTAAPMTFGTTGSNFSVSSLSPNTTYSYRVAPTCGNNANIGTYSAAQTFTTLPLSVCDKTASLATSNVTTSSVKVAWATQPNISQYKVQVTKQGESSSAFTSTNKQNISISNLQENTAYDVNVTAICAANTNSDLNTMSFSTAANTTCTDIYEPNETNAASTPLTPGVSKNANISLPTDKDMFFFTLTPNAPNFKISLTNLPKDYDLHLYNSSGFLIAWSTNYLTASEQIIRYNQSPGTYYVKVSGYSNAYTTSACYDLKVELSATVFSLVAKKDPDANAKADIVFEEITNETPKLKPINRFENINTLEFVLTPNPAQNEVTVILGKEISGNIHLALLDLQGRLLRDFKLNTEQSGNQLKIDTEDLESGMYFISLDNGEFRKTSKLAVQKY